MSAPSTPPPPPLCVGRQRELEALGSQLKHGGARAAVYGLCGMGKTTVALALIHQGGWAKKTAWCDLWRSPEHPPLWHLARVLGLEASATGEQLVSALLGQQIQVIVLDGAQAHVTQCQPVVDLADQIPGLSLVITSSVHLPLASLSALYLAPLMPPYGDEVYIRHARAQEMMFELPADELDALSELVEELGGLPGAITRLVTHALMLPPSLLLTRLDDRFQWLDPVGEKEPSLRSMFAAAIDTVDERAQSVLQGCAVCVGEVGLEEAEAILSEPGAPAWPHLQVLWRHCLLGMRRDPAKGVRFALDPNLRAFLLEQADPKRLADAHRRHAKVMVERLIPATFEDLWFQCDDPVTLESLETHAPVLRRAKAWAVTPEDQMRCAIALAQVALARTSRRQALAELADVAPHPSDTWALATLLCASISLDLGRLSQAEACLEALASYASSAPSEPLPTLQALSLQLRARLAHAQDDSKAAIDLMQQAVAAAQSGSPALLASVAGGLAVVLKEQGKLVPASAMAERALALCPAQGPLSLLRAKALLCAGSVLRRLGRLERAREYLEEGLTLFQAGGLRRLEAETLSALGLLFHLEQKFERAQELYGTSLGLGQVDSTSWGAQRDSLKADYGLLQLEAGSLNAAQELIEQSAHISHLRPSDAALKLQVLLGVLCFKNDQFDSAHHAFEQLNASPLLAKQPPEIRHMTRLLLDAFDVLVTCAQHPEAPLPPPQRGVIDQALSLDPKLAKEDWLRLLHRLLTTQAQALLHDAPPRPVLTMDQGAAWFELGGLPRVDMSRRGPMRAILLTLARAHQQEPGMPVHAVDLFVAGWPDHHGTIPESGLHRLYSTLNRMRKLGLDEVLVTQLEGYVLAANVVVNFV